VTENGAAFKDEVVDGAVQDSKRTNFLKDHIARVLQAKREGIKVNGYFVWTLLDNFEWAEGYRVKFGVTLVDLETQERIPKDSAKWLNQVR
jgi:beta-glucosidase